MKTYQGRRIPGKCIVTIAPGGRTISARLDLVAHSSHGLDWGEKGKPEGRMQLALAILADHFDKDALAVDLHNAFARDVVSAFERDGFSLTTLQVDAWLGKRRGEDPKVRCPDCGASEALNIASYTVLDANTPLRLLFDGNGIAIGFDITSPTDPSYGDVVCQCTRCQHTMPLTRVMEAHH